MEKEEATAKKRITFFMVATGITFQNSPTFLWQK